MSARAWSPVLPGGEVRAMLRAAKVERKIAKLDRRSSEGSRRAATEARLELVSTFAYSYLPPTAEGSALVVRLTGFLEAHADRLGPELLDALAADLDPRPKGGAR